ncbi:MAG: hypothetical protein HYT81_00620 [Gemmatimonadetes bacterium]|nr:hypothetical protein [Gemmatimonadota bacterium]MBI2402785.1 hypothetical protein [Gemmatimonadota bacterium]
MATKTISVHLAAYERLKRAKRDSSESFSDVIMRARWDTEPVTAAGLLRLVRERGPLYRPEELAGVEILKRDDRPPRDKWTAG